MAISWANIASDISGSLNDLPENGLVTRAVLLFPGIRKKDKKLEEVKGSRNLEGLNLTRVNVAGTIKNSLTGLSAALNEATEGVAGLNQKLKDTGFSTKHYKVQFNPSNLQIHAVGGGYFAVTDYGTEKEGDTLIERKGMVPHISIAFRIIVDQTNNADAFMVDKFSINPSGTAQNFGTLAATGLGKKEFTVRPQVEGFLGAVNSTYNRTVVFQWGQMRYAGILNSVQARYTMFSPSGNPIRAEIDVTIQAASGNNEEILTFWRKRYRDIMKEMKKKDKDGNASATTGNLSNQLTNLLNL